jgi:hypothetical protein
MVKNGFEGDSRMSAAAAAGAAHAAKVKAIRASGAIIRVSPDDFVALANRAAGSLVVQATAGVFTTKYRYLLGYKGFAFFTQSSTPVELPPGVEAIQAQKIWIPD